MWKVHLFVKYKVNFLERYKYIYLANNGPSWAPPRKFESCAVDKQSQENWLGKS